MEDEFTKAIQRVIVAAQGNFDHLSGEARENAKKFNVNQEELMGAINNLLAKVADHEGRITALEP